MAILLREAIGDRLRHARTAQRRTLRDISRVARVSLGYLSEVERGQKEASSELLAAICEALNLSMPDLLRNVAADLSALQNVERTDTVPLAQRRGLAGQGSGRTVTGSGMEGGGKLLTGRMGSEFAEFQPQQAMLGNTYDTSLHNTRHNTSPHSAARVVVAA